MCKEFIFVLNNQDEIVIPFSSKLIGKIGDEIGQKITSGKYYVQSEVSRQSFQTFLDCLNDKKENPELTVNNYYEFLLLSDEFYGYLSEYLFIEEFKTIKCLSILKNVREEKNRDLSICNKIIAMDLDYFLKFYSKEMSEIPTTTLFNIFHNEKRKLEDHEQAFQFIKELIKSGKESNRVLLKTLDGLKMSEKSFCETCSKEEENFGFKPEFNLSIVSDIKSQMSTLMNQHIQIMNSINSISNSYLLLTQKIEETNSKIDKIITENDKKNSIANLSQKIEETNSKIDKIITENDKKNSIASLSQKIDETNEKIDNIITGNKIENQKTDDMSQKIINIESKVNENTIKINDIKEKVELIKSKISEIEAKCNNTHSHVLQNEKIIIMIVNATCQNLKTFPYSYDKQFNGIIRQLSNQCGGNVSDKGIVNVTASSIWNNYNPIKVVNLDDTGSFGTLSYKDHWIKYDFINKKVYPVGYLMRSCNYEKNWCHPKSWVVEGSNTDSDDWKILDSRNDCMSLNNRKAVQYFSIQQSSHFYRFLRIRHTDKNWCGNYHFCISALEYFGFIQQQQQ